MGGGGEQVIGGTVGQFKWAFQAYRIQILFILALSHHTYQSTDAEGSDSLGPAGNTNDGLTLAQTIKQKNNNNS